MGPKGSEGEKKRLSTELGLKWNENESTGDAESIKKTAEIRSVGGSKRGRNAAPPKTDGKRTKKDGDYFGHHLEPEGHKG